MLFSEAEFLEQLHMVKVLFVCMGNIQYLPLALA